MTTNLDTVRESIMIKRPSTEVYTFWRQLENLPFFMEHLQEVTKINDRIYHWKAKAPLGTSAEWDAAIIEEKENKLIRWKSIEGSEIENAGAVWFTEWRVNEEGPPSTLVEVEFYYKPPLGKVGALIASLFGENPKQQVKDDLQKLKFHLETLLTKMNLRQEGDLL